MLRDVVLFLAGLTFAAVGIVNPITAPIWAALTVVCVLAAALHWQRRRLGSWLVRLGVKAGGIEAGASYISRPESAPEPYDRAAAESAARVREERRDAIRDVRQTLTGAMTQAEADRNHGEDKQRDAAIAAANRASAVVQEVDDEEARRLVAAWKMQFDVIEKGWRRVASSPSTATRGSRSAIPSRHGRSCERRQLLRTSDSASYSDSFRTSSQAISALPGFLVSGAARSPPWPRVLARWPRTGDCHAGDRDRPAQEGEGGRRFSQQEPGHHDRHGRHEVRR